MVKLPSVAISTVAEADPTAPSPVSVNVSKLPFKYMSTHVPGMTAMLHVETGIADTFQAAFPQTSFALTLGILDQFIAYGESKKGLWSEPRKHVDLITDNSEPRSQNVTEDPFIPRVCSCSPVVIPSPPYTNVVGLTHLHVTKEHVGFDPFSSIEEDPIEDPEDYWPPVCVWLDPKNHFDITLDNAQSVHGHAKECIPMSMVMHEKGAETRYIAKWFHGYSDSKQDSLILGAAFCMGEAAVWWDRFRQLAFDRGQYLAEITFMDGDPLLEDTLNMFTHFVHMESQQMEIMVDFQGFKHGNCFTIFDCHRYTKYEGAPVGSAPGDGGETLVGYHVGTHICSPLCSNLHLPDL
ncbi:hypothetical protein K439DRAFT_1615956 [Ramaria rubella]|nr:hypothetical protein K439DRAFT_1615956 [Ramaria rubella]